MIEWFSQNWQLAATTALAVIGGASVIVKAIAPLTEWTGDDKLGRALDKVSGWLSKLALNPKK